MKKKMTTHSNNLVIVCEGTDTEYLYFTDMRDYLMENYPDRFCAIKVVPEPEEIIRKKNPKRSKMGRKIDDAPQYHYYCKYEHSAEDYERYRAQPTRYVREAALFRNDGYAEAWAVFDCDKHPAHKFAFDYAQIDNVRIAFSSYSFEEWLLAHFERCKQVFLHSECKVDGEEQLCGSRTALPADCHGSKCLGGYLREQKYIADYSKSKEGVFRAYTLPHIQKAMINAAWLRRLSDEPVFCRNPYTDVDMLVAYALDIRTSYLWYDKSESFRFASSKLVVTGGDGEITITNDGKTSIMIGAEQMSFLDKDLTKMPSQGKVTLLPGDVMRLDIPENAVAINFVEGQRNSFVEL